MLQRNSTLTAKPETNLSNLLTLEQRPTLSGNANMEISKSFEIANGSSVDERGKTHHGKSNLFQETPKSLCSTFLPTDVKHCLNVGYTFVNFAISEAVWKSHVCITRKSWPLFKSKKIAQVVHAWIQSKNSLVKHFEDMRLYRPSKEYLLVWFDPPREPMLCHCLTNNGGCVTMERCVPATTDLPNVLPQTFTKTFTHSYVTDSIPELLVSDQAKEIKLLKAKITKLKMQAKPVRRAKRVSEEKVESTARQIKGTEDQTKEEITSQASQTSTQTPTSMIFGDDETIATLLLNMSQAKAASKRKRKGVELMIVKMMIFLKAVKKFKQLESDEKWQDLRPTEFLPENLQRARKKGKREVKDADLLKACGALQHSELKSKEFEDIQAMYEKIKRSDEDFIAIGSVEDESLIKRMNKKDSSKVEEIKQESKQEVKEEDKGEENTRKRKLGTRKKMKSRKRRFKQDTSQDDPSDTEKENDELRLCLTIAPDEDKEVDYEILNKKYPIIDWKTQNFGTKPQLDETKRSEEINLNVVTRSNGQKRYFSTLMRVLSVFDREDLDDVYKLVMDIYQDKIPEGFDKVLWGDLIVMFNPDEQDEFWNSQHEWNIVSWKLHSSSGVHTLMTDEGLVIHMLIEKKYPLKKEILVQMLKLKLESEEEIQDQTVLGKDYSNLLIADSLLKTIWFINAPCYDNEALASPNTNDEELSIPEQTATGKGTSNPLMAGCKDPFSLSGPSSGIRALRNSEQEEHVKGYNACPTCMDETSSHYLKWSRKLPFDKDEETHDSNLLMSLKFPNGLASNISRIICSRNMHLDILEKLKEKIIVILCKLERMFPPSFFDIITHLLIHLPYEAKISGPPEKWIGSEIPPLIFGLKISATNKQNRACNEVPPTVGTKSVARRIHEKKKRGKEVTAIGGYKIAHYSKKKKAMINDKANKIWLDLQNEEASSSCTPAEICIEKLGHIPGHIRGRSASTKHVFETESLRMDLNSEKEKSKQLEKDHLELKENHLKLQKDHVSLTKKVDYLLKHFTAWQSPEHEDYDNKDYEDYDEAQDDGL
ncbi:ribonuclease H-like domain-containing protein [Tanacetum coccineum]